MSDWTEVTVPFGQHRGETVEEIPSEYLGWLADGADMDFLNPARAEGIREASRKELAFRERHGAHF